MVAAKFDEKRRMLGKKVDKDETNGKNVNKENFESIREMHGKFA